MIQLCIDIGNSRTKWGIFDHKELITHEAVPELSLTSLQGILVQWQPKLSILSSVKKPDPAITSILQKHTKLIVLDAETSLPYKNLYASTETLGKDRLALVAGGRSLFPDTDLLIISAGTCITYDFINKTGEYLGGSIHPGIRMRLQAMHTFTEKLPHINPEIPDNIIGNTTVSCLQVGGVMGCAMEILGMVGAYKAKTDEVKVILTGGDAELLVTILENEIFAIPLLSLKGLNEILIYNAAS